MEGILCDILWADPIEHYSRVPEPGEPPQPRVRRHRGSKYTLILNPEPLIHRTNTLALFVTHR